MQAQSHAPTEERRGQSHDLVSGLAGTILALLAWPDEQRLPDDLAICEALGRELVDAAIPWDGSWAWSAGPGDSQPLTGLSHGAAGMGVVLLALHARVGNERFRTIGRGAFAYEALVFDREAQNWPDFRIDDSLDDDDTAPRAPPPCAVAWCHGAPGIALARRHALALAPDPRWQADHDAALATCRASLEAWREPGLDLTPCHGLAGVLEPLVEALRDADPAARPVLRAELEAAWAPLIERHAADGSWPSGLPSRGPHPSLMVGVAGIGWSLLRLHDPDATPSILLPLLTSNR